MLSTLRKVSKDLIIYSALVSEFERLDFKNDALAGVRANFFNAKYAPQSEKSTITIDNKAYTLSYILKKKEPLSWKISYQNHPVQTVKRSADGSYCVISYGENGVIYKRQFFDDSHLWVRTEYYSRHLENAIAAVISPRTVEGLVVLRLERFLHAGIEAQELYPSLETPKHPCAALIYTNAGMLWYDASFKPADFGGDESASDDSGFRFTPEAFASGTSRDVLQLKDAPYLGEEDVALPDEPTKEYAGEEDSGTYSAYDRIESILFEAHKTNKNIFGELANEQIEDEAVQESPVEEVSAEETPVEETPAEEASSEDTTVSEQADDVEEEPISTAESEPEPDTFIGTKNGDYAYYGALDEQQHRTGRGRTVTPDGLTAYDGDYQNDKRHGFGVCYYKEGEPNYIGDWEQGNRSGRGVGFRRSDGTLHVGRWLDNKPDGFGARFDKEGGFLDVCTYADGVRNGKSISFDADGNVVVRYWKNGELAGEKIISD